MWPPGIETVRRLLQPPAAESPLDGARQAAVAAVLRETSGDLEVLLIRRAVYAGDPWSGHVALPGGHAHAGDADLVATAVRETLEEVGVDLGRSGDLLGRLGDQSPHAASGLPLRVSPFYFALRESVSLELNREVEEAFWVRLGPLAEGKHDSRYLLQRAGAELAFPAWQVGSHVVWGLTYRLISELLERIRSGAGDP